MVVGFALVNAVPIQKLGEKSQAQVQESEGAHKATGNSCNLSGESVQLWASLFSCSGIAGYGYCQSSSVEPFPSWVTAFCAVSGSSNTVYRGSSWSCTTQYESSGVGQAIVDYNGRYGLINLYQPSALSSSAASSVCSYLKLSDDNMVYALNSSGSPVYLTIGDGCATSYITVGTCTNVCPNTLSSSYSSYIQPGAAVGC